MVTYTAVRLGVQEVFENYLSCVCDKDVYTKKPTMNKYNFPIGVSPILSRSLDWEFHKIVTRFYFCIKILI